MPVRTGRSTLPSGTPGVATVEWRGAGVLADVNALVSQRLDRAAILVQTEARQSIRAPKSGKTRGKRAIRSAPGEAPASQHPVGLLSSVQYDAPSQLTRRIGTNLDYGLFLEMGAPTINLKPRPWLVPALLKMKARIQRLFKK